MDLPFGRVFSQYLCLIQQQLPMLFSNPEVGCSLRIYRAVIYVAWLSKEIKPCSVLPGRSQADGLPLPPILSLCFSPPHALSCPSLNRGQLQSGSLILNTSAVLDGVQLTVGLVAC